MREGSARCPRRPKEQRPPVVEKRGEVRHRPDAHEDEEREQLVPDAQVVEGAKDAALAGQTAEREVREETAEADGHEQERLHAANQPRPLYTSAPAHAPPPFYIAGMSTIVKIKNTIGYDGVRSF